MPRTKRRFAAEEHARRDMQRIEWSGCPEVEAVPGRVSGAQVIVETRIPVEAVLVNSDAGHQPDAVASMFPPLRPEQIIAVVEYRNRSLGRF